MVLLYWFRSAVIRLAVQPGMVGLLLNTIHPNTRHLVTNITNRKHCSYICSHCNTTAYHSAWSWYTIYNGIANSILYGILYTMVCYIVYCMVYNLVYCILYGILSNILYGIFRGDPSGLHCPQPSPCLVIES